MTILCLISFLLRAPLRALFLKLIYQLISTIIDETLKWGIFVFTLLNAALRQSAKSGLFNRVKEIKEYGQNNHSRGART